MAHKVYRWVDSEGRPTTPPPDPFDIMEQKARGEFRITSDADERKVNSHKTAHDWWKSKKRSYS